MNKKQIIVTWITAALVTSVLAIAPCFKLDYLAYDYRIFRNFPLRLLIFYSQTIIPLLIIGGLLIYTLRDKKNS